MIKYEVVPDVISTVPPAILHVTYGTRNINMGTIMTPTSVKDPPTLKWSWKCGKFYLLAMVDPDSPSKNNPKLREWHHWLVGNIPGNDVKSGEILTTYIGAAPPKASGYHRYVLLVYQQPNHINFDERRLTTKAHDYRGKFKIAAFANKYHLRDPVAGNFFLAEHDEYVDILRKQIGCCHE